MTGGHASSNHQDGSELDSQPATYRLANLEAILRVLRIGDIDTFRAEEIAYGPEQDQAAMARASEQIGALSAAA